jgi:hypothetical protein
LAESFPLEVAGPFFREERLLSPVLEGDGVRIAADQVHFDQGKLRFRLLVTRSFPLDYSAGFAEIETGLVLFLRAGRRAAGLRLQDPTVNPLATPKRNFVDRRTGGPCNATASGYLAAVIEARLDALPEEGALAHVCLLSHQSNLIRVAPPKGLLP